jgi:hypothetical protein
MPKKQTHTRKGLTPQPFGERTKAQLQPGQILMNLGAAMVVGFFFMVILFFGERSGVSPWLQLVYIESMTAAENMLMFILTVVIGIFIGLTILNIFFNNRRQNHP